VSRLDPELALAWLGRRIAELRKAQGLTQDQLAERLGHSSSKHLSRVEGGKKNLSVRNLAKIADALGTDLLGLFAEPEHKSRPRPGRPRVER
jgi:transcriptional regulator with XRE-family HTH domain